MVLVDELPMEFHCDLQLKDRSLTVNGLASGAGGGVADGVLKEVSHEMLFWSGCMKAATVMCQQIFSILALVIFLLFFFFLSASKSYFFRSGVEIRPVLELQFPTPLCVVLLCFATQSLQIAL